MKCAVANCNNGNDNQACNVSFFNFPGNRDLRKKWVSFCRREKNFNPKNCRLCMFHFRAEDVENSLQYNMGFAKYRILKTGAVPTIRTDSLGNVELSAQRTARIEKRENVKIVNSLLNKSHAEDDAQRKQKVEENKTDDENLGCFDASETCIENVQYNSNTGDESLTTLKFEIEMLRKENKALKRQEKKNAGELKAKDEKIEKLIKIHQYDVGALQKQITKAKYELYMLQAWR